MAGRTRHPERRPNSTRSSNVVHLRPRQWLETVEDLVPIGREPGVREPGAREPVGDDLRGRSGAEPQAASWAASDFWGEDAANVQDALDAPVPALGLEKAAAPAVVKPEQPRPSRPLSRVQPPLAPRARAQLKRFASSVRLPRPAVVLALAASLAVLVAIMTSSALGGAAGRSAPKTRAASRAHTARFTDPGKQVNKDVEMLASARIPPLAQPRVRTAKAKSAKRHAAAAQSASYSASPTYAHSASTSGATSEIRSSPPPARPGPTGIVSLVGAGTSPSG